MSYQTQFELSLFENLLSKKIKPSKIENALQSRDLTELETIIGNETTRIINEFRAVTFSNYKKCHFERYIQSHQQATISLIDQLHQHTEHELYKAMMAALNLILRYLEMDHSKYFDQDLRVPESYRSVSVKQLNADLLVLTAKLRSKGTNAELQGLILDYMTKHCAQQSCSYRQQIYVKMLMKNLLKLLSVNEETDWNMKIIRELMYLNFNTNSFFMYCRMHIAILVDAEVTAAKQAARFSFYIKEVRQLHMKPDVAGKAGRPSIAALLLNYLCAELVHLARIQKIEGAKQPVQNLKERAKNFDFKLPVNVTVRQLAIFLELFIRVEIFIIAKGEIMTTMKFFADNLTTVGTDEISANNLNNSRKPNPQTIAWTIGTLEKMLGAVKDMGV